MPLQQSNDLEFKVFEASQRELQQLAGKLPGRHVADLAREVLARLAERDMPLPSNIAHPTSQQIEELCHALTSSDAQAGANFILGVREKGVSAEIVYLHYLAAAARMMGIWWEEDRMSFTTVTLGSSRIFSIMRAMRHLFAPKIEFNQKSAVFASVPGETHNIGITMAADMFRKEGWDIGLKLGMTQDELIADIDWSQTALLGLSIGGQHSIDALSKLIVAVRIHAPAVEILVSGQDTDEIADIVSVMSVDAIADDVEDALQIMDTMWAKVRSRA